MLYSANLNWADVCICVLMVRIKLCDKQVNKYIYKPKQKTDWIIIKNAQCNWSISLVEPTANLSNIYLAWWDHIQMINFNIIYVLEVPRENKIIPNSLDSDNMVLNYRRIKWESQNHNESCGIHFLFCICCLDVWFKVSEYLQTIWISLSFWEVRIILITTLAEYGGDNVHPSKKKQHYFIFLLRNLNATYWAKINILSASKTETL